MHISIIDDKPSFYYNVSVHMLMHTAENAEAFPGLKLPTTVLLIWCSIVWSLGMIYILSIHLFHVLYILKI